MEPQYMPFPREDGIVDKLVGPPNAANPPRVMPERRAFFERLVSFCEQYGEAITQVPQVENKMVDLHRLYIAVRNRGGFQEVTRMRVWPAICPEANRELSVSSSAGYRLRKYYQRHLLLLENVETAQNAPMQRQPFHDCVLVMRDVDLLRQKVDSLLRRQ